MSAYRQHQERPPTPPTVIRYRTYRLLPSSWARAALFMLIGLFMLTMMHATHLVCARDGEDGACVVSSYGIVVSERQRVIPLSDIVGLDVAVTKTAKGIKTARAEIRTRSGRFDLSGDAAFRSFDHANVLDVRSRFDAFRSDPAARALDVWLHGGALGSAFMACVAAGMFAVAGSILWGQLRQLRWIRIALDHDRGVIQLGGREVRLEDVADVKVEEGQALTWLRGKNDRIVGSKIVVETRSGGRIAATREFRAGDVGEHRRAHAALRRALGPRPDAASPEEPKRRARSPKPSANG